MVYKGLLRTLPSLIFPEVQYLRCVVPMSGTEALRDLVPGLGPTEMVPGSVGLLRPRQCCTVGRGRGSEARQIWVSVLVVSLTRRTTLGNLSER